MGTFLCSEEAGESSEQVFKMHHLCLWVLLSVLVATEASKIKNRNNGNSKDMVNKILETLIEEVLDDDKRDCYDWNKREWKGSAPKNPVRTVCGLPICIPCSKVPTTPAPTPTVAPKPKENEKIVNLLE